MKPWRKIVLRIAEVVVLLVVILNIVNFINDVKWHNNGHTPTIDGQSAKKVGDYFIGKSDKGYSVYVSVDFIEANKYCKICEEKESLLYKIATSLSIIKEQPKSLNHKNDFCDSDYGITIN